MSVANEQKNDADFIDLDGSCNRTCVAIVNRCLSLSLGTTTEHNLIEWMRIEYALRHALNLLGSLYFRCDHCKKKKDW